MTPPFLFCSSIIIRTVSLSVVSLIAIVPDSECRMPILIVPASAAAALTLQPAVMASVAASDSARQLEVLFI